jgi:hypothetical protein
MRTNKPVHHSRRTTGNAVNLVLREAKKLQRAATSESLAQALPVLRRLLSSNTLTGINLPELHRRRDIIQRKHLLRMLAIEADYPSWEWYRKALVHMKADEVEHFDIIRSKAGSLNHWFSSMAEAREYATIHGGRPFRVGQQAVVLAAAS